MALVAACCPWRRIGASASNVLQVWGAVVATTFILDREPPTIALSINGSSVSAAVPSRRVLGTLAAFDRLTAEGMSAQLLVRSGSGPFVLSDPAPELSAAVDGTRTSEFELALDDGEYEVELRVVDGAGNAGSLVSMVVTVDTVPPVVAPWQWVPFVRADTTRMCVTVVDVAAAACHVVATVVRDGAAASVPLTPDVSVVVADALAFCGSFAWTGFIGNASVTLVVSDPAGNRDVAVRWVVRDAAAPTHTMDLVAGAGGGSTCVPGRDLTSCVSTAGLVFAGDCASGGPATIPSAPCAVEWAVAVLQVLQQGLCGTSGGSSAGNVSGPAGPWTPLGGGSFVLNVSDTVAAVVLGAGGDRLPVKVAVFARALDEAGALQCAAVRPQRA